MNLKIIHLFLVQVKPNLICLINEAIQDLNKTCRKVILKDLNQVFTKLTLIKISNSINQLLAQSNLVQIT